jgi:hypothetical protein
VAVSGLPTYMLCGADALICRFIVNSSLMFIISSGATAGIYACGGMGLHKAVYMAACMVGW